VFPIPGSQYNPPKTQITFRGTPVSTLGPIQVVGSRSGAHAGALLADSDGQGGSFFPSTPFVVGETVTVSTQLNVIDAPRRPVQLQGREAGSFSSSGDAGADPGGSQRAAALPVAR
jgi:hypothetical protein